MNFPMDLIWHSEVGPACRPYRRAYKRLLQHRLGSQWEMEEQMERRW